MKIKSILLMLFTFTYLGSNAQEAGWQLEKADENSSIGIGAQNLYSQLLKGRTSTTVVVAVIDSGVDVEHEDLQDNVWINIDEIPGNGIDDDNNGYIEAARHKKLNWFGVMWHPEREKKFKAHDISILKNLLNIEF